MKQGSAKREEAGAAVPPESPLVPNRAIERMYTGMVESRLVESRLRKRDRKLPRPQTLGHEACRVSALLDLTAEDFTSDLYGSATTAYLRGEPLAELLKHRPGAQSALPGLLPELSDSRERLQQAMGVALALKRLDLKRVVVVFATAEEMKPTVWLPNLHRAAQLELPMLFVLLPKLEGKDSLTTKLPQSGGLSARSTAAGVPGIPVDASDAIGLYRVAQESIGRARAGGGPALMECLPFVIQQEKKQKKALKKIKLPDPVAALESTLLRRALREQDWFAAVRATFQKRLDTLSR